LDTSEKYWRMPIPHLRGECRRRTLPDDGTKPVLVQRLDENDVWRSDHEKAFNPSMQFLGDLRPTKEHLESTLMKQDLKAQVGKAESSISRRDASSDSELTFLGLSWGAGNAPLGGHPTKSAKAHPTRYGYISRGDI
jgi:hypothetical protein